MYILSVQYTGIRMKLPNIFYNSVFIIIILVLLLGGGSFGGYFVYRTTYYVNYLDNCPKDNSNTFCYIKVFDLPLPKEFIAPLLLISKEEGKRIEIIKKRQKAIPLAKINERFPEVIEWYKHLPVEISKVIGTQVLITPISQPNSLSLVVYEKEGDFIDWHFDTNHYNGRFFTLLIPVSTEPTCGNYQYKDANQDIQTIELKAGQAILFEGDKVFHRGKELCKNQRRVILSLTFVTSQDIPPYETALNVVKNWGIFGQ
jgi:hypothetical protein